MTHSLCCRCKVRHVVRDSPEYGILQNNVSFLSHYQCMTVMERVEKYCYIHILNTHMLDSEMRAVLRDYAGYMTRRGEERSNLIISMRDETPTKLSVVCGVIVFIIASVNTLLSTRSFSEMMFMLFLVNPISAIGFVSSISHLHVLYKIHSLPEL